ncbi:hypothetical protein OC610_08985 [Pseudomonas sp. SAICEU22]|uniref:Uncharacterized protein n=2 Tax=Pseudomonas TaxID=286 RepID=A0A7V8RK31_9PSED|nr:MULTISPECIES: hypothetical protein [Pseudomonas]MBA1377973.1 hypothetical protein [Pseudomonas brassicacearum subsp. neoaurantiaca]MCW1244538.1 hypothetical protein [Pseudomonas agronomica]
MNSQALVLHRRVKTLDQGALHCREMELRLAEDGRHVLFSRYVERYDPQQVGQSATQHYRVPLASMIRWMVNNGERGSAP